VGGPIGLTFMAYFISFQNCIIVGVLSNDSSIGTLDPYPAGSALGFINYASTGETLKKEIYSQRVNFFVAYESNQ
jgi:hypothetical protein